VIRVAWQGKVECKPKTGAKDIGKQNLNSSEDETFVDGVDDAEVEFTAIPNYAYNTLGIRVPTVMSRYDSAALSYKAEATTIASTGVPAMILHTYRCRTCLPSHLAVRRLCPHGVNSFLEKNSNEADRESC
jgi:hypothetical protein